MMKNVGLSAPEALVLMSLPRFDVRRALKIGFIGLLAQGLLRIEQEDRPGLIRTRHVPHLYVAANLPENLPPLAASLIGVVRTAEPDGLMRHVVAQSERAYGKTLVGFVVKYVGPALVARGFAEVRRSRLLGLIPLTRFYRTPAGEVEKTRLEGLLKDARSIPNYLDRDPVQAAALVAALGSAMLLVEELRPHYQAIAAAMRPPDTGGFIYTDIGGSGGNFESSSIDFGSFDLGGIDFSAFDAGALDGFDADFSDAGGDGGGGDGGSSGC
jgi:hypothetical protein